MYKKVELKENGFVGMEHEVKDLWDKKDIIHKNFAIKSVISSNCGASALK